MTSETADIVLQWIGAGIIVIGAIAYIIYRLVRKKKPARSNCSGCILADRCEKSDTPSNSQK